MGDFSSSASGLAPRKIMLSQNVSHAIYRTSGTTFRYVLIHLIFVYFLRKNKMFKYFGQLFIYKTKYTQNGTNLSDNCCINVKGCYIISLGEM